MQPGSVVDFQPVLVLGVELGQAGRPAPPWKPVRKELFLLRPERLLHHGVFVRASLVDEVVRQSEQGVRPLELGLEFQPALYRENTSTPAYRYVVWTSPESCGAMYLTSIWSVAGPVTLRSPLCVVSWYLGRR